MSGFKHAFSLSKAEVKNATPLGTVTLVEHLEWTASQQIHDELRLVPRPSADPADPLNFSKWRKAGILFSMALCPFVANFTVGSIASALPIYASTPVFGFPPKPFSQLTHLIAVNVLFLGASNLWWIPLANIFGRRPVMLVSLLLLVFASMWAGLTSNFYSLLAARIFMGISAGSADAVSPAVVGETFFVHQRGRVMAIYTVFLGSGPFVGPIAGGYIVAHHGLAWLHWTNAILAAITFAVCFLFQPETLYNRPEVPYPEGDESEKSHTAKTETLAVSTSTADSTAYQPYTFTRSLKLFTYHGGVIPKFIAPYTTLRLPGVWLVSLWYAGLVGVIVSTATVAPQIISAPPYLWGKDTGLINVGGLIGTVIGWAYCFVLADWTKKRLAKKDIHGFSEPESPQNPSPKGWIGLQFGMGMVGFGLMQAPSVGFNYIIEAYPALAGDCFVAITSTRAIISFAWTFFVGEWVGHSGAAEPFGIFGMLLGVFGLLTVPFLIWGKRFRIATAKWVEHGL
ncbi:MFS general substrate transporter [Byssothecium circinans]|uniref:MFS general substrate transporter n=1 Tax=Byssothecium circinans TaxID=147558 RepID=A0A6A5TTF9_9PLEO|nr:MFS general substrate transporter [Byssothecium circinans]